MKILIVENDENDIKQLREVLKQLADDLHFSAELQIFQSINDLNTFDYISWADLCILDIQLSPNEKIDNGIRLAEQFRDNGYKKPIIFLTSFREYVFSGYKVHAMDYLLKPVSANNLKPCLIEVLVSLREDYYTYRVNHEIIKIPYTEIISFHTNSHDIDITTKDHVYTQRASINMILSILPAEFVRCHRSCIVNMKHIIHYTPTEIILSNSSRITVGRKYVNDTTKKYLNYVQR